MRKIRTMAAFLLGITLLLSLYACDKKTRTITVENETGYVIADLRMSAVRSGK